MSIDGIVRDLGSTALVVSVAIAAVLALRVPMRRAFGASIAYALWTAVPLALLVALLPSGWRPSLPAGLVLDMPAVLVGAPQAQMSADGGAPANGHATVWLLAVWLAGALASAAVLWRQQRRYRRSLGRLRRGEEGVLVAEHASHGPLVLGAWRPQVVVPMDFAARYPPPQAQLVLAHERMHIARGDTRCNLLLAALRCVYWFNPLLHWAATRFRLDQELACDAAVLARHPGTRRHYAEAMLQTQLDALALPVGCHWQAGSVLCQRIALLRRPAVRGWRRRAGIAVVTLAALSGSAVVLALPSAAPVGGMARELVASEMDSAQAPVPQRGSAKARATTRPAKVIDMTPPKYPEAAVRAGVSGKVMLLVDLDAHGTPSGVRVLDHGSGSAALDAAAVSAAWKWRFSPATEHGSPVPSRMKIPVAFDVEMDPVEAPAGVAEAADYRWYRLGEGAGDAVASLCDKVFPGTGGAAPLCGMVRTVR
ncbi:TonB family protein [Xanthomonas rydalmerensis]|uniref:TonB family protein n=1 Tax=Xanthomonas rydalmerensis TaxID=3046274 RepID=A0ABZ0JRV8_9XANT|nr:TonB family protein [Xanthomonas sp. DM-2023]WOS41842.1 TonB family protein [Xanthomonas sp. DM-2023]WOS46028.1 TonB family protein [Xanthomonas sp. DM-2023]WOS50206.1 TonB family protein [Xanthomonas sp. DM-2023]WOS54386.1 TonB family protein [Xanthomonas sp. DM-2023]WOS58569.1 TonB family protein [Xanthomonas sp. DM-2023]